MEIRKKIEWNGKGSKSKPIIRDPLRFSSHSFSTPKCKFSFRKRLKQRTPYFVKQWQVLENCIFLTGAHIPLET